MKLYNTMTRGKEDFIPVSGKNVKLYTCGPTVYNYSHIGNLRAFVFGDVLKRTLKYFGYSVTQIMNLTDIDDKTIRDSINADIPLQEYTKKYKDAFFDDLENLRFDKAEHFPAATDHIKEMIDLIKVLMDKGIAYQSEDGSVYFSISKFPDYGKLAKIDMQNQRIGGRISSDEYEKDSVADFVLWKAWNEKDGDNFWESPWGRGRPGWHVECSAMSMKYLGETFDIHTGGIDNMFPHHEDELAQSEAATGRPFVNYWMHCEYLIVDGQKMSKSLNNFYTLRDLVKLGFSYNAIRWVLISAHYRKKLNFTLEGCRNAEETLKNFNNYFVRLKEIVASGKKEKNIAEIIDKYTKEFDFAIGDDLNISEALAAVFGLQKEGNILITSETLGKSGAGKILDTFKKFDKILGVFEFSDEVVEIPKEVEKIVEERQQARKNKDFAKADLLRDELKRMGWSVEDTASGPRTVKLKRSA